MIEKGKIETIAKNPKFYQLDNRQWISKKLLEEKDKEIDIWYEVEYEYEEIYWKKIITNVIQVSKPETEYDKYFKDFSEEIKNNRYLQKKYFESWVEKIAKELTKEELSATRLRKYYHTFKQLVENNAELLDYYLLKAQVNYDAWRGSKKEKKAMNEFKKYMEAIIGVVERIFNNKDLLKYLKKHFETLVAYATFYRN